MAEKPTRRAFSQDYLAVAVAAAAIPILAAWKRWSESDRRRKQGEDTPEAQRQRAASAKSDQP